jgi:hypothetical protein
LWVRFSAFHVQSLSLPAVQTIKIGMIEPLSGSFRVQGHEAAPKITSSAVSKIGRTP